MTTPDFVSQDREVLLKKMLTTDPYNLDFLGYEITVLPKVFPPSTPSELLAELIRIQKGTNIIDMGTGTGVLALIGGLQGGVGYAVDMNPDAVKNARLNLDKYGVSNITAIRSDLFSEVPKRELFDLIIFNPPFRDDYGGKKMESLAEYGFSDPSGRILPEFLDGCTQYLSKSGKVLISVAEWEPLGEIERIFGEHNFTYTSIARLTSKRDDRRVYRAYELKASDERDA